MMVQAAPLSKPVQKQKTMSSTPTQPLALKGKRPRDHAATPKSVKPVPVPGSSLPPKSASTGTPSKGRVVKALPGKMDQSAMRKAMYIAFIEDAITKKSQVSSTRSTH